MMKQEVYYMWKLPSDSKLYWGSVYFPLFETIIPYKNISIDEDMGGIELKNRILIDCSGFGQKEHSPNNTKDILYDVKVIARVENKEDPVHWEELWETPLETIECYDALSACVTMEKLAWKYN